MKVNFIRATVLAFVVSLIPVLSAPAASAAEPVTFVAEGKIVSLDGASGTLAPGDNFTVEYSFDPDSMDFNNVDPSWGAYQGAITNIELSIENMQGSVGQGDITVVDNGVGGDTYSMTSVFGIDLDDGLTAWYTSLIFVDPSGTALAGDAMPLDASILDGMADRSANFEFSVPGGDAQAIGVITSISGGGDPEPRSLTVTADTVLDDDLNEGVVIGADEITLDCDGHTISGSGHAGVLLTGRTGVTVKDCHIVGFNHGFYLEGSSGNTIKRSSSTDTGYHAFSLNYSDDNRLAGNVAVSPGHHGFVANASDRNTFKENVAEGGGLQGFHIVVGSDNNVLRRNEAHGFGFGFGVTAGSGNRLVENEATGSTHGFLVASSTYETVLRRNKAHYNANGFTLDPGSSDSRLVENVARNNETGFLLNGTTENWLVRNESVRNEMGFSLHVASHNMLRGNEARRNGENGFQLGASSQENDLIGNVARQNAGIGFWTSGDSSYNYYRENEACRNGAWDAAESTPSDNVGNLYESNDFCVTAGI